MNNIFENQNTFLAEVNAEENLTKTKVAEFAAKLIQLNNDGHVDTLTALARLEFLSQIIDQVKTNYRTTAVDELDLYGPEAKTAVMASHSNKRKPPSNTISPKQSCGIKWRQKLKR
jgi:hypothetical protein